MLRNTFAILLGIIIRISIMIISFFFTKSLFIQIKYTPFIELQKIINTAPFRSLFTAFYVRYV